MKNSKEAVKRLSMIFAEYQIYPLSCYKENSPVRVFQRLYPNNYYAIEIEDFLSLHDYRRIRRGADLPWWGERYFAENDKNIRVMITKSGFSCERCREYSILSKSFRGDT